MVLNPSLFNIFHKHYKISSNCKTVFINCHEINKSLYLKQLWKLIKLPEIQERFLYFLFTCIKKICLFSKLLFDANQISIDAFTSQLFGFYCTDEQMELNQTSNHKCSFYKTLSFFFHNINL